jgi:predicted transcriptional regulator
MPHEKGILVQLMVQEPGVSQNQACKALDVSRSTLQYQPQLKNDMPVIQTLEKLLAKDPAIGSLITGLNEKAILETMKRFTASILPWARTSDTDTRSDYLQGPNMSSAGRNRSIKSILWIS